MCKTFSCWPVLLFYMHIVLSLVRSRNPDNVHCFGTVFMNEISFCIPLLCTPVPLQSENREVAQLSFDTVGPAQLIPMGSNQTRRCNSEFAKWHEIYTPEECADEWMQNNTDLKWLFIQVQIKENIKALRHWPLWGEFTGDQWIPHTKGQ